MIKETKETKITRRKKGKEQMRFENLTDCELLVMKILWDAEKELGLSEVTQRANETYQREWKLQTVSTFLTRLVNKSYLESYRQGRVFYYRILVPETDYVKELAQDFIAFWGWDNMEIFLAVVEKGRAE